MPAPSGWLDRLLARVWWLQLLLNPIVALDLIDQRTGKPDHGKVLPAGLLVSAIVAQFTAHPFAIGALMTLGTLAYGYGMWRAMLKSKSVTSTETIATTIKSVFVRDAERGVQPTADRDWDGKP